MFNNKNILITGGTGSFWCEIMGDDYCHLYKRVTQEGIDLFGYSLFFYGSVLLT